MGKWKKSDPPRPKKVGRLVPVFGPAINDQKILVLRILFSLSATLPCCPPVFFVGFSWFCWLRFTVCFGINPPLPCTTLHSHVCGLVKCSVNSSYPWGLLSCFPFGFWGVVCLVTCGKWDQALWTERRNVFALHLGQPMFLFWGRPPNEIGRPLHPPSKR